MFWHVLPRAPCSPFTLPLVKRRGGIEKCVFAM